MTRPGPRRLAALLILALPALAPAPGFAETDDCVALRAAIEALPVPNPAQDDAAMQRQRDAILRLRETAERTGCGDGPFDDPGAVPCRALARRIGLLEVGLQRMEDRGWHGEPADDGRRRALTARLGLQCSADAGDAPAAAADPDAPAGPAARPRASRVLCVRHCDGAFYPLAADVAVDRLPDMDRVCRAQCPGAESSAYAGGDGDVSGAVAADGSTYASLPAAFAFLKGPRQTCACRAPRQSWAEALAGAEALLQPQAGDVTVTAELAAAMARPLPRPGKPAAISAKPAPPRKGKAPELAVPAPAPADGDLMRQFRGSDPTL